MLISLPSIEKWACQQTISHAFLHNPLPARHKLTCAQRGSNLVYRVRLISLENDLRAFGCDVTMEVANPRIKWEKDGQDGLLS